MHSHPTEENFLTTDFADYRGWGESRTRLFRSGFLICVYPSCHRRLELIITQMRELSQKILLQSVPGPRRRATQQSS